MDKMLPCPNLKCKSRGKPRVDYWVSGYDPKMRKTRVVCECGCCGPWRLDEEDAIAAWNILPRSLVWTNHNHKDKSTWPPRDTVVLVDRGDGMRWFGNSGGIGLKIINEDGFTFTLFLDEEQKTRPFRWMPWPGGE